MYSCGPPHMDVQEWDDQHEPTYSSCVRTRDVTLKTYRRRWMIGRNGGRRSGISAQAARHDDDDIYDTQHYKVRLKSKGEQSREWSSALPYYTPRCSSYWKGSLQVTLDYSLPAYIYTIQFFFLCSPGWVEFQQLVQQNSHNEQTDSLER